MSDFDLARIVDDFSSTRGLTASYARTINHHAVRYAETLGHEGVEFVDCEPHHLVDRTGRRYLDFVAGFAVHHWGRRHPVICAAMEQVIAAPYPSLVQIGVPVLSPILATKITDMLGEGFDRVFFTNSGAETTDYAIKMSVATTGRDKMLYLTGDYHGLTLAALSVNGVTKQQKLFHVDGHNIQVPFSDCTPLRQAFESHGREIAGMIVEPVQARHGVVATDEFLAEARALCDRHGALLVFDEIKTGFGRTGRNFFMNWTAVRPDVLMMAKGLSGGVAAVGALAFSEKVYAKVFKDVERLAVFSSTFRENNLAMAVGLAVMHLIATESPLDNVLAAERRIRERLDGHVLPSGETISVRGKGLQLSVMLTGRGKSTARSLIDTVERDMFYTLCCRHLMTEHQVLTMIPNRFGEAIAAIPALNIPPDAVERFCDAILETFRTMTAKSNLSYLGDVVRSARKLL